MLLEAGFDVYVEDACNVHYAAKMGAPSLPRAALSACTWSAISKGSTGERGIDWRCEDSYSLRDLLRLSTRGEAPDHSWLSKTRNRLPHEVHEKVFGFVLKLVADHGLVKGERLGSRLDHGGQCGATEHRSARLMARLIARC